MTAPSLVLLVLAASEAVLPFPLEEGGFWIYRETYTERRRGLDAITEEETRFSVRRASGQVFVVQKGGADPAGAAPVETGPGFVRLGPWTGDEALPLPLEVGGSGPSEDGRAAWTVEAEERVSVPAGDFTALRCALRTWRSESLLWVAP
ncbi:MAG TPA: hypothetical protein VFM88_13925, partial [Vicinamibacteria bacterium]|nr:hypothetical protein [Vicinamibacteria bacterium]